MTPEDVLAIAKARAAANRAKFGHLTDAERIAALPVQNFADREDLVDKWTAAFRRPASQARLFPVQAEVLETAAWAATHPNIGLVGNVRVGGGKTLAFNLLPEVFDAKRPVLLLPPEMLEDYKTALYAWSQQFKFRRVHVVKYSELSRPEGTDLLRRLNPDLIMADEAQALRHVSSARTTRFLRYMEEVPETRFVPMSGTLTGATLSDYSHLCYWALRQHSPLPHREDIVDLWGSVLNADGEPDENAWMALEWLDKDAAKRRNVEAMRKAFQRRFATAPGVVTTYDSSSGARLVLTADYPTINTDVRDALEQGRETYALPDGTELVDAVHYHRAMQQLSMGFYYVWDWESEPDVEWLAARKAWWGACRGYLRDSAREGVDSPFLVEEYVRREGRPKGLVDALAAWDAQRHKPPPPTRAVWIDYGPVMRAVEWALARPRCFLWWRSRAVGELLGELGIPKFGEGDGTPDPRKHPRAALSIAVHHKGRNYQAWDDQLVLEVPSSGAWWEQLLGRTHRYGQTSPEVRCSVFQRTWPQRNAFETALDRAQYIQDTTGQPQKLLVGKKVLFAGGGEG